MKPELTIETLIKSAKDFCTIESAYENKEWRLQYARVVNFTEGIEGIIKVIDKVAE